MKLDEQELYLEKKAQNFKMNEESILINKIKKRISEIELAIRHTKKTTRIRQNEKLLHDKQNDLQRTIYQHNKFDIFHLLSELMDVKFTKGFKQQFGDSNE